MSPPHTPSAKVFSCVWEPHCSATGLQADVLPLCAAVVLWWSLLKPLPVQWYSGAVLSIIQPEFRGLLGIMHSSHQMIMPSIDTGVPSFFNYSCTFWVASSIHHQLWHPGTSPSCCRCSPVLLSEMSVITGGHVLVSLMLSAAEKRILSVQVVELFCTRYMFVFHRITIEKRKKTYCVIYATIINAGFSVTGLRDLCHCLTLWGGNWNADFSSFGSFYTLVQVLEKQCTQKLD